MPEEPLFSACLGALHSPAAQLPLASVSQLGPQRGGPGKVGGERAAPAEARAVGGKEPGATPHSPSGGPLPSQTGERLAGRGAEPDVPRSHPAPRLHRRTGLYLGVDT